MAQKEAELELDEGTFFCPLCLNVLEEPVVTPCGHNYCRRCLQIFWDEEQEYRIYSCPRCMQTFASRPTLTANTELAEAVEQLRNNEVPAYEVDHCYTGPGDVTEAGQGDVVHAQPADVACDVCTGRKRKAVQSCMDCLASYCGLHLQPHREFVPLKKHRLLDPSKRRRQKTCPHHEGEDLDMFCRTDQRGICCLCSADEHSGHSVVSASEERAERQKELEESQENIQQDIQKREELQEVLLQEMDAVRQSANKAVQEGEEVLGQLIALLETRREELKQEIRSREEEELSRIKEFRENLQRDVAELKRRDGLLRWISDTADHKQFLDHFTSLPPLSPRADLPLARLCPPSHFSTLTEVLSVLREKTQEVLRKSWMDVKWTVMDIDTLLLEGQPRTRKDFLQHNRNITLDPNTSYRHLEITNGGRRAERVRHSCYESCNSERFAWNQVLSVQAVTGRCYWEVAWKTGNSGIYIAVAYKDMERHGSRSLFGSNDKSWALSCCSGRKAEFHHNGAVTELPVAPSDNIGVYLDHSAGLLSFHNVSESMTLLHRVQTTFTQPLHAGFYVSYKGIVTLKTFTCT